MKNFILLSFCCSLFLSAKPQGETEPDNLSNEEKAYVLAKFCTEVKYNFVFYNELKFDWDSLCQASLPDLMKTKTYNEFIDGLRLLCVKLEDGHTNISGHAPDNRNWIKPLPMTTKRVGNQVFVEDVLSSELKEKGIEKGVEIVDINGMNVLDYANKYIRPFTASSTPQWLDYYPYASFELTKGQASLPIKMLLKNKQGKSFSYESTRNVKWDINSNQTFDYKVMDNNIGYLKIYTFMGNNFISDFDEIYKQIENTNGLIIDLRDNTGGNSGFADYITRHLSDTPVKMGKWSSRMYIAAHGSWSYPQEWYMQTPYDLNPVQNKNIYKKPVVLLTNAVTFSSSENFCVTFKGMKRGKIIGTATGGSTGNPINIDLGYGVSTRICTKNEWDTEGNKFIGVGIKPDIEVKETGDIYTKGRDVVIEEALRQL